MKNRAQVSLEYLIVVGAFLSMVLVFMPLLVQTYYLGLFGTDSVKAEKFVYHFKSAVDELAVLGDGSRVELAVNPINEWELRIAANSLSVKVKSSELGSEKTFEVELKPIVGSFSKTISAETTFLIEKQNGKISVNFS